MTEEMSVEQVAHRVLSRDPTRLDDHVVVVREEKYIGIIAARRILERVTSLQVNQAKYANPLTGLPGNIPIETEVEARLAAEGPMAVLYVDLDNFKPYNDRYGVANGDQVIAALAQTLRQVEEERESDHDFLGHLGGDDFIFLLPPSDAEDVAKILLTRFALRVPNFYTNEDLERGHINGTDRSNRPAMFPLLTITVSGIVCRADRDYDYRHIMEHLGKLKSRLKGQGGGRYYIEGLTEIRQGHDEGAVWGW